MQATTLSVWPAIFVAIMALLALGVPLVLVVLCCRRSKHALRWILVGALCFMVGAMLLEQLCHQLVFGLFPGIAQSVPLYVLYGCLAAGVFEETARLVGLSILCRGGKGNTALTGFAYGVGHGGIEALLLGGSAVAINAGALLQAYTQPASMEPAQLAALAGMQPFTFVLPGVERVAALTLHIALSVLVWMVVTKRVPGWFYLVAVALHAVADCPAALYQVGAFGQTGSAVWLCEALVLAIALGIAGIVWYLFKKYGKAAAVENTAQ
ncbi:MAG: YhfC family glutamic-type intramembrane protease [Gemmiger sp.]|nr:YhfC family glutamic-type intramembrane protease [Gemmiger sp.]